MSAFDYSAELQALREQNLYRRRRELQTAQGPRVIVDGRALTNFCSNDYLGLANHPDVLAALKRLADHYGVGSGASHLVCGHSHEHHELERELAAWVRKPRALLFSTGYMANLGVIRAILTRGDAVFEDRLNHASLLDAGLSSGAEFFRYKHLDLSDLAAQLKASTARRKLIVTDGVFSMDGDIAPLPELLALAREHDAAVLLDEAHGVGVLGKSGAGSLEHFDWPEDDHLIVMGTLGKALGSFGAFVAGSENLIELLINRARTYIYTTALPPAVAAATRASLRLVQREPQRRAHLQALIAAFREGAEKIGLDVLPSSTPIQALLLGEAERALQWSAALEEKGFWVSAIRPPTVPKGSARLRITFTAQHGVDDVSALLAALAEIAAAEAAA